MADILSGYSGGIKAEKIFYPGESPIKTVMI